MSLELPLGSYSVQCSVDEVQVSEVLCGCSASAENCSAVKVQRQDLLCEFSGEQVQCSVDVVQVSGVLCECSAVLCGRGVGA